MDEELIRKYAAPAPRYTSYPTAPHFHAGVGEDAYRDWLGELPASSTLSLYIHIPFCDRLCWFCACNTKQVRRYAPLERYLQALHWEIETVAGLIDGKARVEAVHYGGGSPTMLEPSDMIALDAQLRSRFRFLPDAEVSVEIDPNDMDDARFDALAAIGMRRASLGVQDFDSRVQKAINREQSFEATKAVVDAVRARGATSVNLDLLYGLPHQSEAGVAATVDQALTLTPDRIALFGYAHVPWMKKHQTMIDEAALPGPVERFRQFECAASVISASGYDAVGLDHFARPGDRMAIACREGWLRRNFQGYTCESAEALIGLGASAVSQLPQGYVQNAPASADYERRVAAAGMAVVRGFELSGTDRMRAWVIERLMCDLSFSRCDLLSRFGEAARPIIIEAEYLAAADKDGIFARQGNRFVVTARGRPFVRSIASAFDRYFGSGAGRHSAAV
ncbi:coproporphyrinogen-III oxidase [Mesorhizobium sp. L-8-10]|uniref:oxygen-independent coproporphyrinogen III oxidase n=1 Tax=Mesorhizobium sp. L-8-10 TaxID=2744523 RepID=UPI0019273CDB|nr:oxygen-independent coproporphyrinogen III oxidase [Mesorhizobium sp. L-8-10]BCH33297.1 coproporphyrinogen-III oxidase [Mesorhizobium sp. L-8-10]